MPHPRRTTELAPDERAAAERLLGRELADDETVEIVVRKAADLERRRAAVERLRELGKGISLGATSIRELLEEDRR